MKTKLETRTHNKHIQVKTIRTWVMDCIEKIIPTVYEINTSIYKLMWRKQIKTITKSYLQTMVSYASNYCNTFVKTSKFQ